MKKIIVIFIVICASTALFLNSCTKNEQVVTPPPPGNEFLTTTILTLTNPSDPTDTAGKVAIWKKLNPEDTSPPDTSKAYLTLRANTTYNCVITMLDETQDPPAVVSDEIRDRANYHLLCFYPSAGLNLTIVRTDLDTNNPPLPVGLTDNFITGAASNGRLEVVLRHQPNAKDGTCDPGSTDLDVWYTITIQ